MEDSRVVIRIATKVARSAYEDSKTMKYALEAILMSLLCYIRSRAMTGSLRVAFLDSYFSFSNVFTKLPIAGVISILNSSPSFRLTGGFLANPTPAGVPVTINVPAGNVEL